MIFATVFVFEKMMETFELRLKSNAALFQYAEKTQNSASWGTVTCQVLKTQTHIPTLEQKRHKDHKTEQPHNLYFTKEQKI